MRKPRAILEDAPRWLPDVTKLWLARWRFALTQSYGSAPLGRGAETCPCLQMSAIATLFDPYLPKLIVRTRQPAGVQALPWAAWAYRSGHRTFLHVGSIVFTPCHCQRSPKPASKSAPARCRRERGQRMSEQHCRELRAERVRAA